MNRAYAGIRRAAEDQPANPYSMPGSRLNPVNSTNWDGSDVTESGSVDYEVCGNGPTIVLVPGSCSTGAAWRPVVLHLRDQFRCVTTSLLGYGGTAERRTAGDPSISHECAAIETVIKKAGGRVHLVGHSFGGLVALAVALRNKVSLASLVILEAPAVELLRDKKEEGHYGTFRELTSNYFADYERGNAEAIAGMIDFYGGPGTFAAWPQRVKAHAIQTTPVNILDWASAYGFPLSSGALSALWIPTLICFGTLSHPTVQRANELLSECITSSSLSTIEAAAHFMISTHPELVGRLIATHVHGALLSFADTVQRTSIASIGTRPAGSTSHKRWFAREL